MNKLIVFAALISAAAWASPVGARVYQVQIHPNYDANGQSNLPFLQSGDRICHLTLFYQLDAPRDRLELVLFRYPLALGKNLQSIIPTRIVDVSVTGGTAGVLRRKVTVVPASNALVQTDRFFYSYTAGATGNDFIYGFQLELLPRCPASSGTKEPVR